VTIRRIAALAAGTIALASSPAWAKPAVALDSAVFVERVKAGDGAVTRSLEAARQFSRGDRVVTVVTWYKLGGAGGFTVVNPLPRALAYQRSASANEEVSIDGGRTWGKLENLRFGNRYATPEDVTHVRWHIPEARALEGSGRIAYSGIVR
jgi:hypothetical protein